MATYGISAVHLNDRRTHIEQVEYRPITKNTAGGSQAGTPSIADRIQMVAAIRSGNSVWTIVKAANGDWNWGQEVYVEHGPHGGEYLETRADGIKTNNLRALPEF